MTAPTPNPMALQMLAELGLLGDGPQAGPPMGPPPPMGPVPPRMPMGPPMGPMPPGMPPIGPPPGMPGMPPMGMPPTGGAPQGMGGLMPPPPEPPTMDPLGDPLVLEMLAEEFAKFQAEQKERKEKGPFHESWYEDSKSYLYQKPNLTTIHHKANADKARYQTLIQRFHNDIELLKDTSDLSGVFKGFDPENEEAWYSSALTAEKNLMKAKIGGIDPVFNLVHQGETKDEYVQDVDDFIYEAFEETQRQYSASTGGDYRIAVAEHALVYGRIVQRNLPDWERGSKHGVPFVTTLIDPATCFVTREGSRGIGTVVHWYTQTIAELMGDYPKYSRKIHNRIVKKETNRTLDDRIEVIAYWTRRYFALVADGQMIVEPYEHDLGEPPFTYVVVERGESTATRSPWAGTESNLANATSLEDDARRGLSFMAYRKRSHYQREALMTLLLNAARRSQNEPIIVEQDDFAMEKGMPEIDGGIGSRSQTWKNHESVMPYPARPNMQDIGPLVQSSLEDMSREAMPPGSYGINMNSNVSGYAVNSLSQEGLDKMTPDLAAIQQFYAQNASQMLRIYKNWGHLLGEKNNRGTMEIPRRYDRDKSYGTTVISPYTVRKAGCVVKCKMTNVDLAHMAGMANTVVSLMNAGLLTKEQAIVWLQLPGARDPSATLHQVDLDEAKTVPEYKIATLVKDRIEAGDPVFAGFLAKQLDAGRKREREQGGGGPPGGGGPGPIGGVSMPPMGQGPGPGSGPPGPRGPMGP